MSSSSDLTILDEVYSKDRLPSYFEEEVKNRLPPARLTFSFRQWSKSREELDAAIAQRIPRLSSVQTTTKRKLSPREKPLYFLEEVELYAVNECLNTDYFVVV